MGRRKPDRRHEALVHGICLSFHMALGWVRGNAGRIAMLALQMQTHRGYLPTVNFRLRLLFSNQACN
jgi:hypothetical protein